MIGPVLLRQTLKDYTSDITVTSASSHNRDRRTLAQTPTASARSISDSRNNAIERVDLALLVSALFLQRFSLPFGNTYMMLDFVPVAFILIYQFLAGRLVIPYDRLLWFLGVGLAVTCSLLLNFQRKMLTSYFLFMVLYLLVMMARSCTRERYQCTLRTFQLLVMILSCLGVAQFLAQFVVDGKKLIMFYGLVPDFLFGFFKAGGENTIHPLFYGSSILKSNGLFLAEPSNFSQITALGILIEVLEFRRPLYLLVIALGFLVAYSGTGLLILLLFLPLAGLRDLRGGLASLFVVVAAFGLIAMGVIDSSAYLGRVGEFENTHASGSLRFVAPLWLLAKQFNTASLSALLLGSGPGTAKDFNTNVWYSVFTSTWFKLVIEYGVIGSCIFACFLASCLKKSRCPGLVLGAMIINYILNVDFLTTSFLTIMIVLCTLNSAEVTRIRTDRVSGYRSAVGSFS